MITQVKYDKEHDCYLLELPDELMYELKWEIGDTLIWCLKDGEVYLRNYTQDQKKGKQNEKQI